VIRAACSFHPRSKTAAGIIPDRSARPAARSSRSISCATCATRRAGTRRRSFIAAPPARTSSIRPALLALRRATATIKDKLKDAAGGLIDLAKHHRHTVMAGRTHGQHAAPISFGLKAANLLAPFSRHWQRLAELEPRLFVVQFGGGLRHLGGIDGGGVCVARDRQAAHPAPGAVARRL
jgi:hypothetical protein